MAPVNDSDVKDKNFKQLDTKIRHIEDYKKGKGIALNEPEEILLDAASHPSKLAPWLPRTSGCIALGP